MGAARRAPTRRTARQLTDDAATSILGAAAECRALESVIVRSGIEIYGRARGAPTRPDETRRLDPTCDVRRDARRASSARPPRSARRIGVSVGAIRMGTVLGPHVPSPLGRRAADAGRAVQRARRPAVRRRRGRRRRPARSSPRPRAGSTEPVNVVANGAITALQAARRGRRIPIPLVGPDWAVARAISAPARRADPRPRRSRCSTAAASPTTARMAELLGFTSPTTTVEVIDRLYEWPTVVRTPAREAVA